ncbi:MAG: Asp-tRNA(Asn)/Glu-tRNA(Gln) amidotransferase subunit GatC [candidate division KSB1 bacterium]|nr:Asp-tRNA(Asn)/Glu-tRNA(Gln) amidotransferase subunit GatC [candidate division KSB1 bacterium]
MPISLEEVDRIARLAKLSFTEEEKVQIAEQLAKIVEYVEKIKELDLENVPPTTHVVELANVMREDAVRPGLTQEEALRNAPAKKLGFFSVPKVIG